MKERPIRQRGNNMGSPQADDGGDENDCVDSSAHAEQHIQVISSRDGPLGSGKRRRCEAEEDDCPPIRRLSSMGSVDDDFGDKPPLRRRTNSIAHLVALMAFTLLLSHVTFRATHTRLRQRLRQFGLYRMRGVQTFDEGVVENIFKGGRQLSRDGGVETDLPGPAEAVVHQLAPRTFVNRNGESVQVPRGVPLPKPMAAAVNVQICLAAKSRDECSAQTTAHCGWCQSFQNTDEGRDLSGCVPLELHEKICS